MRRGLISAGILCALAGCAQPQLVSTPDNSPVEFYDAPPRGADPNACWGKDDSPAVIETVTEQTLVTPEEIGEDGSVVKEAVYKATTRQAIVKERRELWFQTPCPDQFTPDIIASLQRALKARGLYQGDLTGEMDAQTRGAIRVFQGRAGLDSSVLSLWGARKLGLVAIARPE